MQAHPESAKNSYWEPAEACLTSVETEIALLHYNMRCLHNACYVLILSISSLSHGRSETTVFVTTHAES